MTEAAVPVKLSERALRNGGLSFCALSYRARCSSSCHVCLLQLGGSGGRTLTRQSSGVRPAGRGGKPMGRPSTFTQETADAICDRIAAGESLRTICDDDSTPTQSTVFRWLADDRYAAFREQYARAREVQADYLAEQILEIADDGRNDTIQTPDGEVTNHEVVARSRLRVDARKWLASKMAPKKYGDKLAVGGADDLPPVRHAHELSDADLAAIAAGSSR